jgi:hypothetical protein
MFEPELDPIRAGQAVYAPDGRHIGSVLGVQPAPLDSPTTSSIAYVEVELAPPNGTGQLHLPLNQLREVHADRVVAEVDPDSLAALHMPRLSRRSVARS